MMHKFAVYAFSVVAVAGTLAMMFQRDPLRAAISMLTTLIATAAIYILLSAQLIALLQVIVYAGAIMVLFIIALNTMPFDPQNEKSRRMTFPRLAGLTGAAILLGELVQIAVSVKAPMDLAFTQESVYRLASLLFGRYAFQFELLSLLVLAGVVGAVATAKRNL